MARALLCCLLLVISAGSLSAASLYDKLDVLDKPRHLSQVTYLNVAGEQKQLQDFADEVLLVNFWATWCPPCVKELPSFARLQEKLGDRPVRVVIVSEDFGGIEVPQKFLTEKGIEGLTLLLDNQGNGFRSLGGKGLPTTLIIDQSSNEVARLIGDFEWDSDEVVALVESFLEKK